MCITQNINPKITCVTPNLDIFPHHKLMLTFWIVPQQYSTVGHNYKVNDSHNLQ